MATARKLVICPIPLPATTLGLWVDLCTYGHLHADVQWRSLQDWLNQQAAHRYARGWHP